MTEKKSKKSVGAAMGRSAAYMKSSVVFVLPALLFAVASAVITIIGPDKVGEIATIMSDGLFGKIDLAAIAKIGVTLALLYCLSAALGFLQQYIMASVTLKMSYRLRGELSEKINRVPQTYFLGTSQGDILSRITNDVSTLQQGLTNSLPTIIAAVTQFLGCLVMMFVTEWWLALISLAVTLIGMAALAVIVKRSQRYFADRQKCLGELNGYVEETYSGHEVIKISRAGEKVKKTFDGLNVNVYNANWKSQFLSGIMQPLMSVIGNVAYVAVCVAGSVLAINGSIDFGVIVSFILYVRLFTSPLTQIAQGLTNLQTASASAHRIFDFLESEELPDESGKTAELKEVRGFEGVREAEYTLNGAKVKIAVASGMKNAKILLDQIREGKSEYQFIEIMGCPGGCIAGGGQPYVRPCFLPKEDLNILDTYKEKRAAALYREDESRPHRFSHQNPQIVSLYEDYLEEPNSHKAHELLHTSYAAKERFN